MCFAVEISGAKRSTTLVLRKENLSIIHSGTDKRIEMPTRDEKLLMPIYYGIWDMGPAHYGCGWHSTPLHSPEAWPPTRRIGIWEKPRKPRRKIFETKQT